MKKHLHFTCIYKKFLSKIMQLLELQPKIPKTRIKTYIAFCIILIGKLEYNKTN